MESEKHFQENEGWLHRIENEMKLLGHEGHSPEVRAGSLLLQIRAAWAVYMCIHIHGQPVKLMLNSN